MTHNPSLRAALALLAALASIAAGSAPARADDDPVVFRFATAGDSREDLKASKFDASSSVKGAPIPQDVNWGQNSRAFARILGTAAAQRASVFFENGDMIMGYGRAALPPASFAPATANEFIRKSDLGLAYVEYAYWRGLVAPYIESGMYVLPVPGNHETQCSSGSNGNPLAGTCVPGKVAYPENEDAWRANMGDLIADLQVDQRFSTTVGLVPANVRGALAGGNDSPAPAPTNPATGVTGASQQQLTYSFDLQAPGGPLMHFAVINTDPSGNDGAAPSAWLRQDFADAALRGANAGTPVRYFVFGHKAAYTYVYAPGVTAGDQSARPADRDAFWSVIAAYNATYFCGHEHTYNVARYPDPSGATTNQPYQVLVGSAGSPFEMSALAAGEPASDRYYAWALVQVHRSGRVTLDTYGFDEAFGPTQRLLNNALLQPAARR